MKNIEDIVFQPDDKFMEAMEEALLETIKTGTGIIQTKWTGVDFAKPVSEKTIIFKSRAVGKTEFFDEFLEYCATYVPWDTRNPEYNDRSRDTPGMRWITKDEFAGRTPGNLKLSTLSVRYAWGIK